jgi:alpha-ribazole phosphatase
MSIYLIRHTTPGIESGICIGQADIGVSSTFTEEMNALLPNLASLKIERIYSSPLKRSYVLAEKLSNKLGTELKQDPRLKELNFGAWEMQKWSSIHPTELNMWMIDFVNLKTPHGESYMQMHKRVSEFLNTNDLRDSLIVSHSGVMRSILCSLTNTPLNDAYRKFEFGYNEVYEVDIVRRSYKKIGSEKEVGRS